MAETPPSPTALPLLGHTVRFARDPFGFVERAVDEYGDVVELDVLGTDGPYVLAHPDHAERVLVDGGDAFEKTDDFTEAFGEGLVAVEGTEWADQRQFLQPLFYREAVRGYAETMVDQMQRRVDRWHAGERRPIREEMGALTLEVVFATLFGRELSLSGDDARIRRAASGLNDLVVPTSWVLPDWVPTPSRRQFEQSRRTLREEVRRLLRERAGDEGDGSRDLLSLLAAARDDGGYPRTDTAVEDQLVSMLFAGHETTALALTYTWYLLARHPAVEAQVHDEVDRVVGDDRPRATHLDDLERTTRVVREAMRLYPPIHTIPRRTTRPVTVGGYRIPADGEVHVSVVRIHRDDRFFDDPLSFRPDRWVDDDDRPRFAYLPFGAGSRRCIGREFALTEAVLAVAAIARDYRLEWAGDGALELAPEMTTQPAGDVPMRIRARE
jgi:cytochrome P450